MDRQVFEYHPIIGHRFIPNLKTRIKHESGGYLLKTNNLGFRSTQDFKVEKENKEVKRVLLFGDSYTAGDGVSNAKRFSDLLPSMIPNIEVYNFGMSATGTGQQYLIYQEYAQKIECDLVIIVALAENIRRVNSAFKAFVDRNGERVFYKKPYFTVNAANEIFLHNTPVDKSPFSPEEVENNQGNYSGQYKKIRAFINQTGLKSIAQKVSGFQPLSEYNKKENAEWVLMKAVLMNWINLIKTDVLLVPLPVYQYIEETSSAKHFQNRFVELASDLSVNLHDPLPDFHRYSLEERRNFRFKHDVHPTAKGHQAIARSLQPTIEKILAAK